MVAQQQQPPAGQPPAGQPPAQPQTRQPPATPPAQQRQPVRNHSDGAPELRSPTPPPAPAPVGQRPQLETPKQAAETAANLNGQAIESFEFRGAQRVPQDTLKALIISKAGDIYNEETLRRDFMVLWNTGRFDDIRLETEPGTHRPDRALRGHRAARHPLHQVPGHQVGHRVGNSGPLQGAQSRPDRGIAVRSEQGPARRRRAQGIPGGARPPVRHGRSADRADSALVARRSPSWSTKARR